MFLQFAHKDTLADFPATMKYIFGEGLPNSDYRLDHKPRF